MGRRAKVMPPLTPDQRQRVADNLPLVRWVVSRVWPRLQRENPRVSHPEIVSAGYLGLISAVRYFDATRAQFSTLAVRVIEQWIWKESRGARVIRVPDWARRAACKSPSIAGTHRGRSATLRAATVALHYRQLTNISAAQLNDRGHGDVELAELREAIDLLPERERQLLSDIYGLDHEPLRLRDLAVRLGITFQAVAARRNVALRKLRQLLGEEEETECRS